MGDFTRNQTRVGDGDEKFKQEVEEGDPLGGSSFMEMFCLIIRINLMNALCISFLRKSMVI